MFTPSNINRWTMPDHYFGAVWPDYYRAPCSRTRDSDDLTESNFAQCLARLGGESDTIAIVRERHWAVGWVEWIAIHQDNEKALREADDIAQALDDYPVLNEDDWSAREHESANAVWRDCYSSEDRIRYIRDNRDKFDFHNFADMLGCVRGRYFAGYAGELLA